MRAAKRLQTIHVTKKVQTEAEYAETKARFLAVIAGAGECAAIHRELGELNGLSLCETMRRGPAPYRVFARIGQKQDEIFGEPAWKKQPQLALATMLQSR